jgi:nucleoside-diphosphate-sugar epimerase
MRAAREDIGYRPHISIEEGLHRLREWLKEKNHQA